MVRLWGRDDRFALKDAAIAAALDRSLTAESQHSPTTTGPIEIGVDLPIAPGEALVWFCDPARWTRFQGQQAWLDPRPGGRLALDLGNSVMIRGHYIEVDDHQIAFTWGKEGDPTLPPESTEVTITVVPRAGGCALILRHTGLPDEAQSQAHRSGWRYHLLRLAVAAGGSTGETELIDLFLAASSEPDPVARRGLIERACIDAVEFSDGRSDDFGASQISAQFSRLVESGQRRARVGTVERRGAIARCDFAIRRSDDDDIAPGIGMGELVATIDGQKLTAVSFFELQADARRAAHAAPSDPWRDAPSPEPVARPRRDW